MRKLAAVLLCVVAVPAAAHETLRRDETRSAVALRGGYGLPFGEAVKGLDLADMYSGLAPGWIELGARSEHTFFGLYFQYAATLVENCPEDAKCSGYSMRAGVEVLYSFVPDARFSPWAGAGLGWEGLKLKTGSSEASANAFEFANVQLGGDLRVTRALTVGPYVTASFARFSQAEGETIEDPATHAWVQVGLRSEVRF